MVKKTMKKKEKEAEAKCGGQSDICKQLCKRKCDFKALLRKASDDDIKAVVDMSASMLSKKVPLNKPHVKLVLQNRRALRHLVHPQFSLRSKKKYLIKQQGGGLASALGKLARVVGRALKPAVTGSYRPIVRSVSSSASTIPGVVAQAAKVTPKLSTRVWTGLKRVGRTVTKPYRAVRDYARRHNRFEYAAPIGATGGDVQGAARMFGKNIDTPAAELAKFAATPWPTPGAGATSHYARMPSVNSSMGRPSFTSTPATSTESLFSR